MVELYVEKDNIISSNKEKNIEEIDLDNIIYKDLDIIDINNLNIDNNEEYKVNNSLNKPSKFLKII